MKILLDTHILLWAMSDDERLPQNARDLIEQEENEIYFSIISLWEIQIKHILHPNEMENSKVVFNYCKEAGFITLPLSVRNIHYLPNLKRPDTAPRHKDPYDRMLICQAVTENMLFLTHDSLLSDYHIPNVIYV